MAMNTQYYEKKSYNLGVIGSGRTCSLFLRFFEHKQFPFPGIRIVGMYDPSPGSNEMIMLQKAGILFTENLQDLFKIENLDAVIDLTNNNTLSELTDIGSNVFNLLDHDAGKLIKYLFQKDQELIKVKEQASLEKKNYDILFQQTDLGVVVIEPDFVITDANDAYLESVGKQRTDILGKTCHEVVKGLIAPCPVEEPGFDCPLVKTLKTGKSSHIIHGFNGRINGTICSDDNDCCIRITFLYNFKKLKSAHTRHFHIYKKRIKKNFR